MCISFKSLLNSYHYTGNKELGSAELEFFRHRIHLERDMIRQAKNSLQAQQSEYRSRLHNFQQRQSSSSASLSSTTLYQMAKEVCKSKIQVKIDSLLSSSLFIQINLGFLFFDFVSIFYIYRNRNCLIWRRSCTVPAVY